jgi:hypothetical protein
MTPAIEYLIRTDCIKKMMLIPCSLFLNGKNNEQKLVITISEEFNRSKFFSIKHWQISTCSKEQVLPCMTEYRVLKTSLFTDKNVILKEYNLIPCKQQSIDSNHNYSRGPMSSELYSYYFENTINGYEYKSLRTNWLWNEFIKIYIPNLYSCSRYIPSAFHTKNDVAEKQRDLVSELMKKEWEYWQMWQKHLLQNPAEIIFHKEYLNM